MKNANWSIHIQESTEFVRYSRKLCGEIYCIFDEKSQSNVTGINASLNSKYFESLLEIARSRKPLTFYITARSRSLKFDYYQNIMIWDGKAKDTLWLSEIGFSVSL